MKVKNSVIKRRRRLAVCLGFFLILLGSLFFFFRKKDYDISYNVSDYTIKESYNKSEDYYQFVIQKEDQVFYTMIADQHFSSKKVIYQVDEVVLDNTVCLRLYSNKARFVPLCSQDNEQISYHLVSEEMKERLGVNMDSTKNNEHNTYQNIDVYNTLYANVYVWNYRGFYRFYDNKNETITLFSKDVYHPSLIQQVDHYLLIPDYESDYSFQKIYLLDMNSGKVNSWQLDEAVYFDSVWLGVYDGEAYLVDKHEKVEWKFNVKKKQMIKIGTENKGGIIYQNGFHDITMNKLVYQENKFSDTTFYDYTIKNDGLYFSSNGYDIKIRMVSPSHVASYHDGYVYYFEQDKLYGYHDDLGEVLMMQYFEWNFNLDHVVFIY